MEISARYWHDPEGMENAAMDISARSCEGGKYGSGNINNNNNNNNKKNNNNNNNLICIAPACRMTSEALADSSSRATECLTEK